MPWRSNWTAQGLDRYLLAAGERLRVTGEYQYDGRTIFNFNNSKQLGKGGSGGCSHEWWHRFNPAKQNEQLRAHVHMKLREIAYFLSRLDETIESNGKSILETIVSPFPPNRVTDDIQIRNANSPAFFTPSPRGWAIQNRGNCGRKP